MATRGFMAYTLSADQSSGLQNLFGTKWTNIAYSIYMDWNWWGDDLGLGCTCRLRLHPDMDVRVHNMRSGLILFMEYENGYLTFSHAYFFLCRHLEMISDLLFSVVFGSAIAMASFSLRYRSHLLEPGLYDAARCTMLHFTSPSMSCPLSSHR